MGGIIRTRIGTLSAAALLSALAVPAIGQAGASAATADLYVNNSANSKCTDSGTGMQSAPFCTIQAAADAALPGQTVHVAAGQYKDELKLTHSGTADAPISFVAAPHVNVQIGGTYPVVTPKHGVVVTGAQHLRFQGFMIQGNGLEPVAFDHAMDVSMIGANIWFGGPLGTAGVRVGTGSSKVTIARSSFSYISGPNVVIEQGASDTVVSTNQIEVNSVDSYSGIVALGSPGTVVVSNTVHTHCGNGVILAGASTGAVVENNVIDTANTNTSPSSACAAGKPDTGLTVSAEAAPTAKADYNVINPVSGGPAYDWAGVTYKDQAGFTAASSQGAHDFVADPGFPPHDGKTPPLAPWIDSADESAPGMLALDAWGYEPAKDDPVVSNTGTGSGYRDRGASEYASFGSVYTPVTPARVLDTRDGTGSAKAPVQSGSSIDLQLAGDGIVPPAGVTAVTLNLTVTRPTAAGFLTVYPHGQDRPTASNLNWVAGTTIANLVTVPVVDGKVSFYAGGGAGSVDVIADIAGYYSAKGSVFTAAGPARLLDTRDGTGGTKAPVQGGSSIDLQVAGAANGAVPLTGVTAVTLNVTVTGPTTAGFLTVYPHGQARPTASNLNWTAGTTIANLVTVPVVDGKVSFFAGGGTGSVDVIADIAGYYSEKGYDTYWPTGPWRVLDTRMDRYDDGGLVRKAGVVAPGETLEIRPVDVSFPHAVTLNVTVTEPQAAGFLTVFPSGTQRPVVSNLNWSAGQTIPNQAVVKVGADGKVSLYNGSKGSIHLVVDVFGYQEY